MVRDYNGQGRWAVREVQRRYTQHAKRLGVDTLRVIEPERTEEGDTRWVYPIMEPVIAGIEAGDLACAQIGVEFIEEDRGFPFGAILKSNTARALRRVAPQLTDEQTARIRTRVARMITDGPVPREYREYARLLRKIGAAEHSSELLAATAKNYHAARALAYYRRHVLPTSQ